MCEIVDGKCNLKRTHIYYPQVQGQLALSTVKWCDFVVFCLFPGKLMLKEFTMMRYTRINLFYLNSLSFTLDML